MAKEIVRVERDGVEFFTEIESGESGMSISGVARLCGVSHQAVSKVANLVATKNAPKRLKALESEKLWLQPGKIIGSAKVSRARILTSKACAAIIKHYAFEGRETAEFALDKFTTLGVDAWIQSITGWTQKSADTTRYLTGVVLLEPKEWTLHYSAEWQIEACRLTGEDWKCIRMGKFIKESVYAWMPAEVQEELDKVNPPNETGRRPSKQHQHFSEDASPVLRKHIEEILILMKAANSMMEFREFMNRNFSGRYQLSLKMS